MRPYTARTTRRAGTARGEIERRFDELVPASKQRITLANATRVIVIENHLWLEGDLHGRRVIEHSHGQITRIAEQEHRTDRLQDVAEAVQRISQISFGEVFEVTKEAIAEVQPEGSRVHFLFGQRQQARTHVFESIELDLLETDDLPLHTYFAVGRAVCLIELRELAHLRIDDRIGKVIGIHLPHEGFAPVEVQFLHLILAGIMKIDRLFVQRRQGGWKIDFADDAMVAGDVDDQEVIAGDGAQTDGIGWIAVADPAIAGVV